MADPKLPDRQEFINGVVTACVMWADMNGLHDDTSRTDFAMEIREQLDEWIELPEGAK